MKKLKEQWTFKVLLFLLILGVFNGCATVKPEPFVKYGESFQEMRSGVDAILQLNYQWARQGYVDKARKNKDKLNDLFLNFGQKSPYDWNYSVEPLFVKIKKLRRSLGNLNDAFAQYINLMIQLSGGEIVKTETFEKLASDLNSNSTSAINALNNLTKKSSGKISLAASGEGLAIFSTAASEIARLYIENKRQKYLKEIIKKNQAVVQDFAASAKFAIKMTAVSLKKEYAVRKVVIIQKWIQSEEVNKKKEMEKWDGALIDLAGKTTDSLDMLRALDTSYTLLSNAHKDLGKAIEKGKPSQVIKEFSNNGKRLNRLYQDLNKSNKKVP